MNDFYIIPEKDCIKESIELSKKYNLGWEFNDFFNPAIISDLQKTNDLVMEYLDDNLPVRKSLHGAFYDITVFSSDPDIRNISDKRIRQSMGIAVRLGVDKVIFHTNFIPGFESESYKAGWLSSNEEYFGKLCKEYSSIQILMENMFDTSPELLERLARRLSDVPNFGICFDYAHAVISGRNMEEWAESFSGFVKHVHINDNDLKSDLHEALGDGKIDFEEFARLRKLYFPNTSVLIEVRGIEKQKKSLAYLEKLNLF